MKQSQRDGDAPPVTYTHAAFLSSFRRSARLQCQRRALLRALRLRAGAGGRRRGESEREKGERNVTLLKYM